MSINLNSLVRVGQLSSAMTAVKTELDRIELNGELNLIEDISIDGTTQSIANKTVSLDLSAYAKKTDVASGVRVKGTVADFNALPANAEVGDMYNITAAGGSDINGVAIKAGDNVVKTADGWDNFGGLIDLSGKVDKVTSAVTGNVVTFGANGTVLDSGYTIAGDSDISTMLTGIFGARATTPSDSTPPPPTNTQPIDLSVDGVELKTDYEGRIIIGFSFNSAQDEDIPNTISKLREHFPAETITVYAPATDELLAGELEIEP